MRSAQGSMRCQLDRHGFVCSYWLLLQAANASWRLRLLLPGSRPARGGA
jgi:hypothetical protein